MCLCQRYDSNIIIDIICNKVNINQKNPAQNVYDEKKLMQKVNILTNKILKILKKDAIIDLKLKINEIN